MKAQYRVALEGLQWPQAHAGVTQVTFGLGAPRQAFARWPRLRNRAWLRPRDAKGNEGLSYGKYWGKNGFVFHAWCQPDGSTDCVLRGARNAS